MFKGRGTYARFKDLLASKGLLDPPHDFEDQREEEAWLWCEENQVEPADDLISCP